MKEQAKESMVSLKNNFPVAIGVIQHNLLFHGQLHETIQCAFTTLMLLGNSRENMINHTCSDASNTNSMSEMWPLHYHPHYVFHLISRVTTAHELHPSYISCALDQDCLKFLPTAKAIQQSVLTFQILFFWLGMSLLFFTYWGDISLDITKLAFYLAQA